MWVLGIEPRTSGKAADAFNCWATSPAQDTCFLLNVITDEIYSIEILVASELQTQWATLSHTRSYTARCWWWMPWVPVLWRQRQAHLWVQDQPGLQSELPSWRKKQNKTKQNPSKTHFTYKLLNTILLRKIILELVIESAPDLVEDSNSVPRAHVSRLKLQSRGSDTLFYILQTCAQAYMDTHTHTRRHNLI